MEVLMLRDWMEDQPPLMLETTWGMAERRLARVWEGVWEGRGEILIDLRGDGWVSG